MSEAAAVKANPNSFQSHDNAGIRDWLNELNSEVPIKVSIHRVEPKEWDGQQTEGHVITHDGPIGEDEIQKRYGGGKYTLRIMAPDASGRLKYKTQTTIKIAGSPKLGNADVEAEKTNGARSSLSDDLVKRSFDMTAERLRAAEERAERSASTGHLDPTTLQALQSPLVEQLRAAEERIRDLSAQMVQLMTKKPEEPFKDMAFRMYETQDRGLSNLREQHQSEIRQLKESQAQEIRQIRENARDDIKARERSHDREIEALKESLKSQKEAAKTAYETRIDSLKSDIARLERDLAESKGEIGALKARKEKGPIENMTEVMQLKEKLDALGVGGDGGGEEKWYEKMFGVALASPLAQRILGEAAPIEGSAAPHQLPAAPQPRQVAPNVQIDDSEGEPLPPIGQPFQSNGQILMRTPNDRIVRLTPEQAAEIMGTSPGAAPASDPEAPSELEVQTAVNYMEQAINNGIEPEDFAASARNMIRGKTLQYLRKVGVDHFLDHTAKLESTSVLQTEHGRIFARKVSEILLTE